jgi:hypothetical protein
LKVFSFEKRNSCIVCIGLDSQVLKSSIAMPVLFVNLPPTLHLSSPRVSLPECISSECCLCSTSISGEGGLGFFYYSSFGYARTDCWTLLHVIFFLIRIYREHTILPTYRHPHRCRFSPVCTMVQCAVPSIRPDVCVRLYRSW